MAKVCIKKDLQHLEHDIDDLIMLEDSARGTLCAIHKAIHSNDNFPCSSHKMLKLCPVPKVYFAPSMRNPISRSKRKTRSNSPCHDHAITGKTNDPCHRCCRGVTNSCCRSGGSEIVPPAYSANYINVEKTISCPEKMCCQNSQYNRICTINSKSSVQIDKFAQGLLNTDEVVSELKGEIERVKDQLHRFSLQRFSDTGKCKTPTDLKALTARSEEQEAVQSAMSKLRNENKRLKREIEAKRRLLDKSKADVEKAKEILLDYEKKVGLLHVQAMKSSKAMKLSKDKFYSCLNDRDKKISNLKDTNQGLETMLKEKDFLLYEKQSEINTINECLEKMKISFEETSARCTLLTENNLTFFNSIEKLQDQLSRSTTEIETHKETIKQLEQKLKDLTTACKKVTTKTKKQKESYESQIKTYHDESVKMTEKITELSIKLDEMGQQISSTEELESRCENLQEKIEKYENYSEKCKSLEEQCKELYENLISSEKSFNQDKKEMHKLINELTTIVQGNKVTILQMTEINKQQGNIIQTQSMALLSKEEQLKLIEKESENFRIKNMNLEKEVEKLKKSLSEPCSRDACLSVSRELEECRNALNVEKDTQLIKEKIIQDQSQTILNLQCQVKEKMFELNKAQSDTVYLEEEISRINEKLIKKHKELDREVDEKDSLIEKLRILECQKNQLTEEIGDFEEMLHDFKKTCGDNAKQQKILKHLECQIKEQKHQWEVQKRAMTKEKKHAVCAAKFATQKLLDTVEDFQRQVDAQKKVQLLLTKMLHEKDEQLRVVTSKISNINSITKDVSGEVETPMKELFFRRTLERHPVPSDLYTNTNTSIYSSCSSCCKKTECGKQASFSKSERSYDEKENNPDLRKCTKACSAPCSSPCIDTSQMLRFLNSNIAKIQEEPSRDIS